MPFNDVFNKQEIVLKNLLSKIFRFLYRRKFIYLNFLSGDSQDQEKSGLQL